MVIVVEGKNDYNKIKNVFPDANIVITNGDAINESTINEIKKLAEKFQIVVLMDPDFAGEKIRKQIAEAIPCAEHIYATRALAISKNRKKIGIEHMSNENIRHLLKTIKKPCFNIFITKNDLLDLGLIGTKESKRLRMAVCQSLNIGYANGKQFLKKCHMFGISLNELRSCL